jgi:hypothetical protein
VPPTLPCYVRKRFKPYPHYFPYSPSARYRSRCKLGGPSCPVTVPNARVNASIAQDAADFSSQAFSLCSSFAPSVAWHAIIAFSVGHSLPTQARNARYLCVCHSICHAQATRTIPMSVADCPCALSFPHRYLLPIVSRARCSPHGLKHPPIGGFSCPVPFVALNIECSLLHTRWPTLLVSWL